MPWPQTGATQYHAELEHTDKGLAIKGFCLQYLESRALGLDNRSGPSLLKTVP